MWSWRPSACSGAMNSGVPMMARATVSFVAETFSTFEIPKSTTFANGGASGAPTRNTLSGFRSR